MSRENAIKEIEKEINKTLKDLDLLYKALNALGGNSAMPAIPSKSEIARAHAETPDANGDRKRAWRVWGELPIVVAKAIYNNASCSDLHFLTEFVKMQKLASVKDLDDSAIQKRVGQAISSMYRSNMITRDKQGRYKYTDHGTKQFRMWRDRQKKKASKEAHVEVQEST